MSSRSDAYTSAGVDIHAGNELVSRIKTMVASTHTRGVLSDIGGFGGLFRPDISGMQSPVLVSGTDGVGTKLKLASMFNKHDTVGIDLVAMSVNDCLVLGAKPLFFLDYFACGELDVDQAEQVVAGVVEGCRQSGCSLLGGETAEMPGMYAENEYDLAGFSVGLVDRARIIDGSRLAEGDCLIGLASSGVHSNGFSLVRKVFDVEQMDLKAPMDELEGRSLGETLLAPTRIYVRAIQSLLKQGVDIHAVSHITGGGFYENVPRMMTEGLTARIRLNTFPCPPIFRLIAQRGSIPERDMYNTFNMGIGMVIALPAAQAQQALQLLEEAGECAYLIGEVTSGELGVELVP
jgi:phosphoribosylformylglycinamidine cyclo-ligase